MNDDVLVKAVKTDYRTAAIDAPTRAILEYATKLTLSPSSTTKEDLESLRRWGLGDSDLLDLVEVVGFFNYINRVADGLHVDPEDFMPPYPK